MMGPSVHAVRRAGNKRLRDRRRAAGLCACGGTPAPERKCCVRCLTVTRLADQRETDGARAYNAAMKAARDGLRYLRAPIVPVVCSAVIVGGAVVVAR